MYAMSHGRHSAVRLMLIQFIHPTKQVDQWFAIKALTVGQPL